MKPFFKTQMDAEAAYFELLRFMTPTERLTVSMRMSSERIRLQRERLEHEHPGASKREIDLLFVELNYGEELARKVRKDLVARGEIEE